MMTVIESNELVYRFKDGKWGIVVSKLERKGGDLAPVVESDEVVYRIEHGQITEIGSRNDAGYVKS